MIVFVVIALAGTVTNGENQCGEVKNGILSCSKKSLTTIPRLPLGVVKVDLRRNKITAIEKGAFSGLKSLQELLLYRNKITTIAKGVFAGLSALKTLQLADNKLTTIARGVFTGLTSLQKLSVDYNQITAIAKGVLTGMTSLRILSLAGNKITTIAKGVFAGLISLQELDLVSNQITTIAKGAFTGLTSLRELLLYDNQITTIAKGVFAGLSALKTLNLIHNPLMCDCVLVAALSDLKGKTIGYCESTNWEFETVASLMKKVNCKSCKEGLKKSGAHFIKPDGKGWMNVYCNVATNGEVWTVIQRRQDAETDFDLGWEDYNRGFGSLSGNFWLGNKNIHRLTDSGYTVLRVELTDYNGKTAWAEYGKFGVASEVDNFRLSVGSYSGNAGDSLSYNNGMSFTTKDRDNDQSNLNCAKYYGGAWWHKECTYANLNGRYQDKHGDLITGVKWYHWKMSWSPIKKTEMKVRKPHQEDNKNG